MMIDWNTILTPLLTTIGVSMGGVITLLVGRLIAQIKMNNARKISMDAIRYVDQTSDPQVDDDTRKQLALEMCQDAGTAAGITLSDKLWVMMNEANVRKERMMGNEKKGKVQT